MALVSAVRDGRRGRQRPARPGEQAAAAGAHLRRQSAQRSLAEGGVAEGSDPSGQSP